MSRPVRLGLFAAAPVYYQAPLYRRLAADPRLDFTAIFASTAGLRGSDEGYGRLVRWDEDALWGYESRFLRRAGRNSTGGRFLALRDTDVVGEVLRGRYETLWVHGYHSLTHVFAAATQRLRRAPLLFREEQTLLHPRPPLVAAAKRVGLPLLFRGAYGLAIGTENRGWFERYGIAPERLFPAPYVVDGERLRASADRLPPRAELRARFGIAGDAGPVVVTVGRLIPKKQPLFLLEAFARVRAARRCALLVVGSGELEEAARAKVERDAIPDVAFAGFLNQGEVAAAYRAADVFTMLSREHETWGLVVNEAMELGLPVVTSDKVGSSTDLVHEGVNGHRVPCDDVDAAAAAIGRLVDSADRRAAYGRASSRIIADWTYHVTAAGIVAAVAAAVGEARWQEAAADRDLVRHAEAPCAA